MSHFDQAFQKTVGIEGGYSNHPDDPGGETMFGITVAVARYHGYTGPMRDLPLEVARRIYRVDYWDPLNLDAVAALAPEVAEEMFDTNVNFYSLAAGKFLQAALNSLGVKVAGRNQTIGPLVQDGDIGRASLEGLRQYLEGGAGGKRNPRSDRLLVLLRTMNGLQVADYVRQVAANPKKQAFFFGWVLKRVVL